MKTNLSRRQFVHSAAAAAGVAVTGSLRAESPPARPPPRPGFRYSLNTSTIRGQKLTLPEQVELCGKLGFQGIEPWLNDVNAFVTGGGNLSDLKKRCGDLGLKVISAIGFPNWVVNDDEARAKGVEQMKKEMDLIAQLGGSHIAAPPAGAYDAKTKIELDAAADRYRVILEAGRNIGVIPQLEFWGGSANLNRLDQCLYIATRAAHADACVLPDIYHLHKGATSFESMRMLSSASAYNLHMNDYAANPPRESLKDSDRIWPGDGIAPISNVLRMLAANTATTWLSVELFNPDYWKLPAEVCARTGLEKMKACVAAAGV